MNTEFETWANAYKNLAENQMELMWPSETLIRVFKGNYVLGKPLEYKNKSVLDVGFGNGNNLIFLNTLGMKLSGVEVHEDICQRVQQKFNSLNVHADLRKGTNSSLPFEDNCFDFLVSWNVLHYEKSEEAILAAIKEYSRVLKPGGRFFISTTGPEHKILEGAQTLGGHLYQIGRDDDFRKGEKYFYFDAPNYIQHYFTQFFKDVQVGRTHDQLFKETLDWYIITGVK